MKKYSSYVYSVHMDFNIQISIDKQREIEKQGK